MKRAPFRSWSFPAALAAPLLAAVLVLAGCRTLVPVNPVQGTPFAARPGVTLEDRSSEVWRAALPLGWTVDEPVLGSATATLRLRDHVTVVRVDYDVDAYSIHLVETQNIERDGDLVHPNVNGWIAHLEREIAAQSMAASAEAAARAARATAPR